MGIGFGIVDQDKGPDHCRTTARPRIDGAPNQVLTDTMRRWVMGLLLGLAALAAGCALPPLDGRSVSVAVLPDTTTTLGREVAPMLGEHPGKTGVVALKTGHEGFAARVHLADIAERSLDLQYYIWHADLTGTLLMDAVLRAADRGVRVRLLLDDDNTAGMDAQIARLDAHPNIEVRLYNPFVVRGARWWGYLTNLNRLNHRMHNKSFTADGWVTIMGGRNIGNEYFNANKDASFVDLDVMVVGNVVSAVASEFDRYWASDSAYPAHLVLPPAPSTPLPSVDPVDASEYLNALEEDSAVLALKERRFAPEWVPARLIVDDPRKTSGGAPHSGTIRQRFTAAMGEPKRQTFIVSPYFVPSRIGAEGLVELARGGVDTRVLTNSFASSDVAVVHAGYVKYRHELLRGGVRLFELRPDPEALSLADPLRYREPDEAGSAQSAGKRRWIAGSMRASLHAKTSQVDRERVYVGSFNFNPRSMEINTEMGLVIESPFLAIDMAQEFERGAKQASYEVKLNAQDQLVWIEPPADGQGPPRVMQTEPGTTLLQRVLLHMLSWLPIEWLL